jgi:hypothetical protein
MPDPHCALVNWPRVTHVVPSQQPFAHVVALHAAAPAHVPAAVQLNPAVVSHVEHSSPP